MAWVEQIVLGLYEMAAALGILAWWAFEWASTGRSNLLAYGASHIVAELATTSVLLVGGVFLLLGETHAGTVSFVGLGMLLYATVNALGRVGRESGRLGAIMAAEAVATALIIVAILTVAPL